MCTQRDAQAHDHEQRTTHTQVGALTIHHPDWMDRHPSGSQWDAHGTPVRGEAVGGSAHVHKHVTMCTYTTYLEVTHSCHQVGCARRKTSISHSSTESEIFLLMLVYAWMEFPLLISGIWLLKCSILLPTNSKNPKREYRET